jgi:methionine-rich copper-binding protein CopC
VTAKKTRKPMADNAAVNNFVFGDNAPTPAAEPIVEAVEPIVETVKTVAEQVEPTRSERVEPLVEAAAIAVANGKSIATTSDPISTQSTTSLMSRLMQNTPEKEATVRLTVDLPKSTHTKLSVLCAHNGLKKAEVVRMLLEEALKDTNV